MAATAAGVTAPTDASDAAPAPPQIADLRKIVVEGKAALATSGTDRLTVHETVVYELEKTLIPARAALAAARAAGGQLEPARNFFVAPGALAGNSLERLRPAIESGSLRSCQVDIDPRAVAPSDADAAAAAAGAAAEKAAAAEDEPEAAPLVAFDAIGPNAKKQKRKPAAAAAAVAPAAGVPAVGSGEPAAAASEEAAAPSAQPVTEKGASGAGVPAAAAKAKPPRKRKATAAASDAGTADVAVGRAADAAAAPEEPVVAGKGGGAESTAASGRVAAPTRSPEKRCVKRPHSADMVMYG